MKKHSTTHSNLGIISSNLGINSSILDRTNLELEFFEAKDINDGLNSLFDESQIEE